MSYPPGIVECRHLQRVPVGARYVLMSMVASGGQSLLIFRRATWRFKELKAFVASTRRTASVSLESKAVLTACTAASIPAICPPHIWEAA